MFSVYLLLLFLIFQNTRALFVTWSILMDEQWSHTTQFFQIVTAISNLALSIATAVFVAYRMAT